MNEDDCTRIKKCCASCAFKRQTRALTMRRCTLTDNLMLPSDLCEHWQMSRLFFPLLNKKE